MVAFKSNGEYRLCLNFSGPLGDSPNDYIEPFNLIEAPFSTLRRLLRRIAVLEYLGATDLLGGKHDIDAAFKTCGVRPEDWNLFGFKVRTAADTADDYYFSRVGVFRNRTSCALRPCTGGATRAAPMVWEVRSAGWTARCTSSPSRGMPPPSPPGPSRPWRRSPR